MKVFGALSENCSPVKKEFGSQPGKALYDSAPQINAVVVGRLQKKKQQGSARIFAVCMEMNYF